MADTGFSLLETPRLLVRRFHVRDLDSFVAYRSQPETARFQSWDAPFPRPEAEAFLAELAECHPDTPGEWFQFAVERRSDGVLLGDVGLRAFDDETETMEIGYTLDIRHTGQGYAADAVAAVLDYALVARGKRAVQAWTDRRHVRSHALLARLGFVPLETPPRIGVFKGETCEDIGHVMTAEAWRAP